ncbi:hypothetical protein [Agrococcus sp. Marseille-Q4369]|uniref:hypothetical protein n=1 Tax=Agrococcus sp. Marseille-Q4369 TaxID=2810513 RepID=UPI001B8CC57B|nr:hypothetical protein [Agrococcus sp. Marseille-Q4369]QUW19804.1 hypothetical protein JSQ78_05845 [Agrococcus sp. Marseille-Q4369]
MNRTAFTIRPRESVAQHRLSKAATGSIDREQRHPEPALDERSAVALRDVVGMLRSFDYAAGSAQQELPDADPAVADEWVRQRQREFLAGYADASNLVDEHDPVFRALLLDKALYEVVYDVVASHRRPRRDRGWSGRAAVPAAPTHLAPTTATAARRVTGPPGQRPSASRRKPPTRRSTLSATDSAERR